MDYLSEAIFKLCPNSEFSLSNNDYSTIKWDKLDGAAPTQKQIDDEIKNIKSNEIKVEADKVAAKQSAQAKLTALGLTEEEVASILG